MFDREKVIETLIDDDMEYRYVVNIHAFELPSID